MLDGRCHSRIAVFCARLVDDYVGLQPTTKGFVHLPNGSIAYLRQTWLDR